MTKEEFNKICKAENIPWVDDGFVYQCCEYFGRKDLMAFHNNNEVVDWAQTFKNEGALYDGVVAKFMEFKEVKDQKKR